MVLPVNRILKKLEEIDSRLGRIEESVERLDLRVTHMDLRLARLEESTECLGVRMARVEESEGRLEEQIKHLVTRDEFITNMDKILYRLTGMEQEMVFMGNRIDRIEEGLHSV